MVTTLYLPTPSAIPTTTATVVSWNNSRSEVAQRKAFEFIENGWVEFLGTDMHNVEYALALRHASTNKKIIKLMETTDFENKNLAVI